MKKKKGGGGFGNVQKSSNAKTNAQNNNAQTNAKPKKKGLGTLKIVETIGEPQVNVGSLDDQDSRIEQLLGDTLDDYPFNKAITKFYDHLSQSLKLPCDVKGMEDFRWEERYVFDPSRSQEYERLRKTQPSYQDVYELLSIERGVRSKWMLYAGEDIAAHVRRKSDGKTFCLGLAELEAIDKTSQNYQLIDDYSMYFVNYR